MDLDRFLDAIRDHSVFCAYNANVDALVDVDAGLADVLGEPADEVPDTLRSPADLAAGIRCAVAEGEGDEVPVSDDLGRWLATALEPRETRVGGQAGIMSDLLAALGAAPILYTYMLSEEQRAKFPHADRIRVPVAGEDLDLAPMSEVTNSDRTKTNWIFEFARGAEFHGATSPAPSRFIAASRPEAFDLETPIASHARDLGERVDAALLSGYHDLKEEYADGSTFRDHVATGAEFLRALERSGVTVQVEYGVTHHEPLRQAIVEEIVPHTDVVSVDPQELELLAGDLGIDHGDTVQERYRAMRRVVDETGVGAVRLHATDYFLAARDGYAAPGRMRDGFRFAAVVVAAKALRGTVDGPDDLRAVLDVPVSDDGRAALGSLADDLGLAFDGAVVADEVVGVPNRVVDEPESTVGLGDAVAASSFVLEDALGR